VLWIHNGFNGDPEPDPAFYFNADPDPRELNQDPQHFNMAVFDPKNMSVLRSKFFKNIFVITNLFWIQIRTRNTGSGTQHYIDKRTLPPYIELNKARKNQLKREEGMPTF
jgi:hypothetical protein